MFNTKLLNEYTNDFSHMPFKFSDDLFLFCQLINNRWKLSCWDGINKPIRLNTGIICDLTHECSPECVKIDDIYHISFITAEPNPISNREYLFKLRYVKTKDFKDLTDNLIIQNNAQTGFVYAGQKIVYSHNNIKLTVHDLQTGLLNNYKLMIGPDVLQSNYAIARTTYFNNDSNKLLISLVKDPGRYCSTILFELDSGNQYLVKNNNGDDVYKCFIDSDQHILYYSVMVGTGHESRQIRSTEHYTLEPINAFIKI